MYSLPHGSFGTVDFFQYGPFQFVTPAGAVISACRPSCVVGIAADFELVEIERLADLADLDLRGVGLGLFALADEVAADDAEHDADQHQHDENFDERHAAVSASRPIADRRILVPLQWTAATSTLAPRGVR